MRFRPHRPPGEAFTLLEIMIAIAIFSLIMVAVYSSWSAILRGTRAGQKAAAEVQRARVSMNALVDSLSSAQMYQGNADLYSFIANTEADFAGLSLVSHLPETFPGSGLFGEQTVRRVTFTVESTNSQTRLVMRQTPLLATPLEEEPYPIVLARDVQLFQLEFWDPQEEAWGADWLPTNQLPDMVRVSLGLGETDSPDQDPRHLVTRVVQLMNHEIPLDWQAPNVGVLQTIRQRTPSGPGDGNQVNQGSQPNERSQRQRRLNDNLRQQRNPRFNNRSP